MFGYLLLGEVNIGRSRLKRLHAVLKRIEQISCHAGGDKTDFAPAVPERYHHFFSLGHSIGGFHPAGGNAECLLPGSNEMIDAMTADIDSATDHVRLLFYIWLPDYNGTKIVEALKRAASRGVSCRVMADDLGWRGIIRSEHWQAMRAAGVRVASGLPISNHSRWRGCVTR
jgi:cardiolipin synthase A/B